MAEAARAEQIAQAEQHTAMEAERARRETAERRAAQELEGRRAAEQKMAARTEELHQAEQALRDAAANEQRARDELVTAKTQDSQENADRAKRVLEDAELSEKKARAEASAAKVTTAEHAANLAREKRLRLDAEARANHEEEAGRQASQKMLDSRWQLARAEKMLQTTTEAAENNGQEAVEFEKQLVQSLARCRIKEMICVQIRQV